MTTKRILKKLKLYKRCLNNAKINYDSNSISYYKYRIKWCENWLDEYKK